MYRIKNAKLCDEINSVFELPEDIRNAFMWVDREIFVPEALRHRAYSLDALPLLEQQWISSPLTVAKMTKYLLIDSGVDSVLEIGCGSGYQAVILSRLIRRVFSIERIEKLLLEAKSRVRNLSIHNINIKLDDGQNGWVDFAPYDRILFSACIEAIPSGIYAQLSEGGIIVAPIIENGRQIIKRFTKTRGSIYTQNLEECLFVPIKDGILR